MNAKTLRHAGGAALMTKTEISAYPSQKNALIIKLKIN